MSTLVDAGKKMCMIIDIYCGENKGMPMTKPNKGES